MTFYSQNLNHAFHLYNVIKMKSKLVSKIPQTKVKPPKVGLIQLYRNTDWARTSHARVH